MGNQFKIGLLKVTKQWQGLTRKLKIIIVVGVSVALLLSVVVPFVLRNNNGGQSVLYRNLSSEESSKIYATLQEMSVNVSMNSNGEITVPTTDVNQLKLQLSSLGYPKSGLSYDTFSNNAGFMSTELEKKQYLLMDLQSRLQETIRMIDGVNDAVVTLNIPQDSNYIWETSNQQSTGSVMLALNNTMELTQKQVIGIQNLVASSVPKMVPANVTIVNAATGTKFSVSDSPDSAAMDKNLLQLQFEKELEKKMEDKVLNLLTLPYGVKNVRVSASVVLDYDKMLSEEIQYIPELNGKGVISKLEEWYSSNKDGVSSGIVGEEENTDVPSYPQISDAPGEVDEFNNKAEYLVSYIKTQIEHNTAITKVKTISVVLNNTTLSEEDKSALITTVAKAANVDELDVVVNSFMSTNTDPIINPITGANDLPLPYVIGGIVLILLLLLVIILMLVSARKKSKQRKLEEASRPVISEADALQKMLEEQKSRELEKNQVHSSKAREILGSIQDFSYQNPEIAATLIRDLLREDD